MRFDIVARDGFGMWSCDKDVGCDVMFQIVSSLFVVYIGTGDCARRVWKCSEEQTCCIRLLRVL